MALFKTVSICGRANYQIAYAEVYMNPAGRKLIGYNKELFSVIQRKLATIPIWPHLTKCLTVLRRHLRLTQRPYSLTQLHQASTIGKEICLREEAFTVKPISATNTQLRLSPLKLYTM